MGLWLIRPGTSENLRQRNQYTA